MALLIFSQLEQKSDFSVCKNFTGKLSNNAHQQSCFCSDAIPKTIKCSLILVSFYANLKKKNGVKKALFQERLWVYKGGFHLKSTTKNVIYNEKFHL